MKPSAVVFDLGKVLVDFDYSIARRRFARICHLPERELHRLTVDSPLLIEYELGRISTQEFYERLSALMGFGGSFPEFRSYFAGIFTAMEPMIALHAALRARGVPTFIFSNTNELAITHVRGNFPFYACFDGYVLSYEHGAMKPDAALYAAVERAAGRNGAELLYIDDRPENIAAGQARGWQVILQEQPEQTAAAVRALGLLG